MKKSMNKIIPLIISSFIFFSLSNSFADIEAIKKQIAVNQNDSKLYLQLAQEYFSNKMVKEGFEALNHAIKLDPKNPELYFDLSRQYAANNKPKEAFEAINEAVKLDPSKVQYWKNRGEIANWLKNPAAMEESYSKAHQLDPNDQAAILGLARASVQLKKLSQAASLYETYLAKNPTDKEATIEYINVQIWSKNTAKAKQLLADYKARFGDSPVYQNTLKQLEGAQKVKANAKTGAKPASVTPPKKSGPPKPVVKNAQYYVGLSQNYSAKKQTQEALEAINKALEFDPTNITYLKTRGQLANWAHNLPEMQDSYAKILALEPHNPDAVLGAARACSWQGKMRCAVKYYKLYLTINPKSEEALIEFSSIKRQLDAYRDSRKLLMTYRHYFGETKRYQAELANLYASARWYQSAERLNSTLLADAPNNLDYLITKSYTQYAARQYALAMDTLQKIRTINPKAKEIDFLNTYLHAPWRSYVSLGEQGIADTHTVRVSETGLEAYAYFTPATALRISALYEFASAKDLAYTPVTGGQSIYDVSGKFGIFHRFAPYLDVEANVGALNIDYRGDYVVYNAGARWYMNEKAWISYRYSHDLFRPNYFTVFSPRSISLAILEDDNVMRIHIEPALQRYIDFFAEYNPLSDGNRLLHANLWPSARLFSAPGLILNAGVSGDWYSFKRVLPNDGYYSPRLAQIYLGTISMYHGFSLNNGITFSGGVGVQKDETLTHFFMATDASVDAIFGFFKDWQLELIAGYSYRGNPTKPYEVVSARAVVTRRF